jgi:ADP-heptose:LPS heptosyltransferase
MNITPGYFERLDIVVKKIAIFRASRIGDFLCATPAFRAIRQKFPAAEISLIGLPLVRDLAERSPHIDRFIAFPGFPGIAEQLYESARAAKFLESMRKENFDLVIQMHGSGRYSNPIALQFHGRRTVGFVNSNAQATGLHAAFRYDPDENETARLLHLLSFLGIEDCGSDTDFFLTERDQEQAELFLTGAEKPLIGIHPSAREATKKWPITRFIVAARRLLDQWGGRAVLVGDQAAASECALICGALGKDAISLAGRTSLPVLGAVISRLNLLISNDSGPAHIAYALRVPTVTIFGSTDPFVWMPPDQSLHKAVVYPVDCRPCDYNECPIGNFCLMSIEPEDVVQAAGSLLAPAKRSGRAMNRCLQVSEQK